MLISAIDDYLKSRPRDERAIRCFHPSSLHKSPKELYWHYLEGDNNEKFDSRILRIFDNGHGVHERLQKYLKDMGVLVEAEVPVVNQEYEICGSADGIIKLGIREGVLEIKSINSNGFYSTYEPKSEHIIQINVYMFCLEIPRGCVLYENKDNQELKEFYVKLDNKILDHVLEKIRYVQECMRQGKAPN